MTTPAHLTRRSALGAMLAGAAAPFVWRHTAGAAPSETVLHASFGASGMAGSDIGSLTASKNLKLASYKLSKRIDQDISAVCAAFAFEIDGNTVREARIAYGGMAAIPARAKRAEAALLNQPWNSETIERACAALAQDFKPLSDMRASADYRLVGAQNLLRRFWVECSQTKSLRTHEVVA